jgi:hypothetical protein
MLKKMKEVEEGMENNKNLKQNRARNNPTLD